MTNEEQNSLIEYTNRGQLKTLSRYAITGQFYRPFPFPMLTVATGRGIIELYGDEAKELAGKLATLGLL